MQPERQISVALTAVSITLIASQCGTLVHHADATPGTSLLVGAVLGALGVFGGSLMAASYSARSARVITLLFWTLTALALSGGVALGAVHSPGWGGRIAYGVGSLLLLAGPAFVLSRRD